MNCIKELLKDKGPDEIETYINYLINNYSK